KFDYIHVAVPTSKVLEYRRRCLEILQKHSVHPIEIGFWVRPEFFSIAMRKPIGEKPVKASKDISIALHEMLSLAQDFQGSMEYCHGVGLRLANLMSQEHGVGLDIMRTIKKAMDPKQILNPGKLGLV
ncbi:MAG: FAD-binding oxidoreductase, partial [Candidatus Bathyarchaeia archaeon]